MNTVQLRVTVQPKSPWEDIFIAELSEAGFDAFENNEDGIVAYGPENQIDVETIKTEILEQERGEVDELDYSFEILPFQNWNEIWEKDFEPVFVEDKLTILAPFHDRKLAKGLIVEIQPQMSFGTGHHQTTWLMSKALLDFEKLPNRVLDMGTGTGVLAILAEKLVAQEILAIDIEDWSVENAKENVIRNSCTKIQCVCGGEEKIGHKKFDLILANINKNVLKAQMATYSTVLNQNGILMISGFFDSDTREMIDFVELQGLKFATKKEKETWAMLEFIKK